MDIELVDFKKYFNNKFWKSFKSKVLFYEEEDLSLDKKAEIISSLYLSLEKNSYYPSIPRENIYEEKKLGIARNIPVFEIKDYCIYYYCLKRIEDKIAFNRVENTYGGWTLGGDFRKSENDEIIRFTENANEYEDYLANELDLSISTYSFNPKAWAIAYGDLNSKLYSTIKSNDYEFCIEVDIANFYDSINLDLLELWIREVASKEFTFEISILFHFLGYWDRNNNSYNKKTIGLPQDALADCSRILANFYLQDYDDFVFSECESLGYKYFRYADDQFIFGNDEETLKNIVFKLSKKLNSINLNFNSQKSKIWKTKDLLKYRSFELFDLVSNENKSEANISIYASRVLDLYRSNDNEFIKNKGTPLLKRLLSLDIKNIPISQKIYIKGLFLEESFLKGLSSYYFKRIYFILLDEEKDSFIKLLEEISNRYPYNGFLYQVLQFFEEINLDTCRLKTLMLR